MHEMVRHRPRPVVHGMSAFSIAKKTTANAKSMMIMTTISPEVPQSSGRRPMPQRNMGGSMGFSMGDHDGDCGLSSSRTHPRQARKPSVRARIGARSEIAIGTVTIRVRPQSV